MAARHGANAWTRSWGYWRASRSAPSTAAPTAAAPHPERRQPGAAAGRALSAEAHQRQRGRRQHPAVGQRLRLPDPDHVRPMPAADGLQSAAGPADVPGQDPPGYQRAIRRQAPGSSWLCGWRILDVAQRGQAGQRRRYRRRPSVRINRAPSISNAAARPRSPARQQSTAIGGSSSTDITPSSHSQRQVCSWAAMMTCKHRFRPRRTACPERR